MNKIQKEVWDVVLTYTELIMQGKVDEFLEYFHEGYSGWSDSEPIPVNLQNIKSELRNLDSKYRMEGYDIIPIQINIYDKLAIVHYYLTGNNGTDFNHIIKHHTDVLIKNKNKWVLIADCFGVQKKIMIEQNR